MEGTVTQLGLNNYLINNKDKAVSFFKHSYKNYSNFAKDTRRLYFKGDISFGSTMVLRLDEQGNYGDLISNLILEVDLPDVSALTTTSGQAVGYCNGVGNALIERCDLKIGGNYVDQHTGEWMDIWSQLAIPKGKQDNYNNMIKKTNNFVVSNFQGGKLYIPLFFWFCQNTNYNNTPFVLPMVSLRNNEIEIIIKFRSFHEVLFSNDNTLPTQELKVENASMLTDYIVLAEQERSSYLLPKKHMYLMNQIQNQVYTIESGKTDVSISMRNFKYPITEILFIVRRDDNKNSKKYFNYSNSTLAIGGTNPIKKARLTFDGRDRIAELDASYFTQVEPSKVHDSIPNSFIHCYSFSLQPENMAQPSGCCNFSEIYEPILHLTMNEGNTSSEIHLFAINYNVLQIDKSGNAWLLHNLSKSAPAIIPSESSGLDNC